MIYAIHAVGTEYVKIGVTAGTKKAGRLSSLQTGCPFELVIVAQADWPHHQERIIHRYLKRHGLHVRGEWFMFEGRTQDLTSMMRRGRLGLQEWHEYMGAGIGHRLSKVLAICR